MKCHVSALGKLYTYVLYAVHSTWFVFEIQKKKNLEKSKNWTKKKIIEWHKMNKACEYTQAIYSEFAIVL